MASLSIRKLDDDIYKRLRLRAKKHGVSMEEEARQILFKSLHSPEKISDVFKKYFGPQNGVDDMDISFFRKKHEPMEFGE